LGEVNEMKTTRTKRIHIYIKTNITTIQLLENVFDVITIHI